MVTQQQGGTPQHRAKLARRSTGLGEPQQAEFFNFPSTEKLEKCASVHTLALLAD